jgi:hypothetical protein
MNMAVILWVTLYTNKEYSKWAYKKYKHKYKKLTKRNYCGLQEKFS